MKYIIVVVILYQIVSLSTNGKVFLFEKTKEKSLVKAYVVFHDVYLRKIDKMQVALSKIEYSIVCNNGVIEAKKIFFTNKNEIFEEKVYCSIKRYLKLWDYIKKKKIESYISMPPVNDDTQLFYNELRLGKSNYFFCFGILNLEKTIRVYDIKMLKNPFYLETLKKIIELLNENIIYE